MAARTVTGASTRCTLLSSTRISMALRQSALTSASVRGSHRFSCSICRSRSDAPISGSAAAAGPSPLFSLLLPSRSFRKRRRGGALLARCFSKILGLGSGLAEGGRGERVRGSSLAMGNAVRGPKVSVGGKATLIFLPATVGLHFGSRLARRLGIQRLTVRIPVTVTVTVRTFSFFFLENNVFSSHLPYLIFKPYRDELVAGFSCYPR